MERKYIACFFDLKVSEYDYLEETLLEYDIGQYIIGHETHNAEGKEKSHFHLLFEATEQIYTNFSKRIIDKYGLRRKGKGGVIKYGKVKQIRDIDKMKSYTVKDSNIRTNIPEEELQNIIDKSFKKTTQKLICEEIREDIDRYLKQQQWQLSFYEHETLTGITKVKYNDPKRIVKKQMISISLERDLKLSKAGLQSYYIYWLKHSELLSKQEKISILFDELN